MILTRRKFIQRLSYMMAGGLIVPYVPKVFYSIPGVVKPELFGTFGEQLQAVMIASQGGYVDPRLQRGSPSWHYDGEKIIIY